MDNSEDKAAQKAAIDRSLSGIRLQINSGLENQRKLAMILMAIEENLSQQHQDKTPAAYFVSFLALLDNCSSNGEITDFEMASGALYFLALVSKHTSKGLLQPRFADILTRIIPALTDDRANSALVRSGIHFLEALLLAQSLPAWKNVHNYKISPRRGFQGLLELSIDHRPKVRKAAQQSVSEILSILCKDHPNHPANELAAQFALSHLSELLKSINFSSKNPLSKENNSKVIHNLQLIACIAKEGCWPLNQLENLCNVLLEICKSTDEFLTSSVFNVFKSLFNSIKTEQKKNEYLQVLNIIYKIKPSEKDRNLAPVWLSVVSKGVITYSHNISSIDCLIRLPDIFKMLSDYLQSNVKQVATSVTECLTTIIFHVIDQKLLLETPAVSSDIYDKVNNVITELSAITNDLLSVKYQQSAGNVAEIIGSLFQALGPRANPGFIPQLLTIGSWRSNEKEGFDFNDVAETVISHAVSAIGPEAVLNALPLNLTNPNAVGRAWMLPILRDSIGHAHLGYFIDNILPITGYFDKLIAAGNPNSMNVKIFTTIVEQIWSLLPGFCDLPLDIEQSFTDSFASRLSKTLYKEVIFRTTICHALKNLAESNYNYVNNQESNVILQQTYPVERAQEAIKYLSETKASNLLSVLFNVFSETPSDERGYILDAIDAYLKISRTEDLVTMFNTVCTLLKKGLDQDSADNQHHQQQQHSNIPRLSITMLELVNEMIPYIPQSSHDAALTIFNQTVSIEDVAIQKRSYKILTQLFASVKGKESVIKYYSDIIKVLEQARNNTLTPVQGSRLQALEGILNILPGEHLELIPAVLPEVILATKSTNEKAREIAYDILVLMGQKMQEYEGQPVKNSINDKEMPDSNASLKEFFVMCSAGLAGGSPHMISATVTALSRIFYEFHSKLPPEFSDEMISTIQLFLTSKSREIIKPALGFAKVACLALPEDYVKPRIKGLLTTVFTMNHEQSGHFRSKIKLFVERLIRKFGLEYVGSCVPEEDRRLITNIRKTKARNERKKEAAAMGEIELEEKPTSKKFMSAYEEALYGESDSENESKKSDDENYEDERNGNGRRYISESMDTPLDLLDKDAFSHISSSKPRHFTKSKAKYETRNGKIVFGGESFEKSDSKNSIDAYVEAIKQGPVRGSDNKLRYKKQNRKDNITWDDDNSEDEEHDDERHRHSTHKPRYRRTRGGRIGKPRRQQRFKSRKKL